MPLLSIIVPVYKVERFLSTCINSILRQTFKNFELILVDDGSPDNCGMICDEYAQRDSRIIVIHQDNKGLNAARNAGINIAKGQLIAFVDSDDYIEEDMYEILVGAFHNNHIDIAVCGINSCFNNCNQGIKSDDLREDVILSKKQCFETIFSRDDNISVRAWNKVYKKEVFFGLRYPEGQNYEDVFIITDILSKCNSIFVTTAKLYNYRQHSSSITGGKYSKRDFDRITSSQKNYIFFKEHYPQFLEHAEAYLYKNYFWILDKMALAIDRVDFNDIELVINTLNSNLKFVLRSREFSLSRKISAIMLKIHPFLFKVCVKLQYR